MPRNAQAQAWWADPDLDRVRERIERRRAREAASSGAGGSSVVRALPRRGVREVRRTPRLVLVSPQAARVAQPARRRPRLRPAQRLGPRPDRIAAWAVVLGLLLLFAAIISSHG